MLKLRSLGEQYDGFMFGYHAHELYIAWGKNTPGIDLDLPGFAGSIMWGRVGVRVLVSVAPRHGSKGVSLSWRGGGGISQVLLSRVMFICSQNQVIWGGTWVGQHLHSLQGVGMLSILHRVNTVMFSKLSLGGGRTSHPVSLHCFLFLCFHTTFCVSVAQEVFRPPSRLSGLSAQEAQQAPPRQGEGVP